MDKFKIGMAMRFFLLVMAGVILLGIWLTGFNTVHWVLYLPAAFFMVAAVTGLCPGMGFSRLLFPPKK